MGNRKQHGSEKRKNIAKENELQPTFNESFAKSGIGGLQPVIHHKGFEDKSRKPIRQNEEDAFLIDGE